MELIAHGKSHAVSKSGPDYLILTQAAAIPAGPAELTVIIDGEPSKFPLAIEAAVDGRRIELIPSDLEAPANVVKAVIA